MKIRNKQLPASRFTGRGNRFILGNYYLVAFVIKVSQRQLMRKLKLELLYPFVLQRILRDGGTDVFLTKEASLLCRFVPGTN